MNKQLVNYDYIISVDNILVTWDKFVTDKKSKLDIQEFSLRLMNNIFKIHHELTNFTYHHGPYSTFHIYDPKHRIISKASVKDRLIHHLVFNELYNIFNPTFIHHSYSSRVGKGTHVAVRELFSCLRKVSHNYIQTTYILKCDIKKFFWSVDHQKLFAIIQRKIKDEKFLWLINEIINSFPPACRRGRPVDIRKARHTSGRSSTEERERERELKDSSVSHGFKTMANTDIPIISQGLKPLANGQNNVGIPIGNVTSQVFANIYLNKLDQFVKHKLKIKHYFRYADDFVIIHQDKKFLQDTLSQIKQFLQDELFLEFHPGKVSIRKLNQGVDFLGYVILPHYIVMRTKTKRRMIRKIKSRKRELEQDLITEESFNQSVQSYLGILKHCQGYQLEKIIKQLSIYEE